MTKSDVLDAFDEVNACVAYEIDGKQTREMPFQLNGLKYQTVLEHFQGWSEATATSNAYDALPAENEKISFICESYLNVPVQYVSNGPGRDQILEK